MNPDRLTLHFIVLRALRWLPLGLVLPFLTITPVDRGLSLGQVGAAFAVHSAVAILLEVPSGVLADTLGRKRVLLAGAALTAVSLAVFAFADGLAAFMASLAALAAGRALISGALEAWFVDSLRALDPSAPLASGLSRGTAAEAVALGAGALAGGAIVTVTERADITAAGLSGYGLTAVAASLAALVYLVAVAALVHETPPASHEHHAGARMRARVRSVVATARAEAVASVTVRMVLVAAVGFGMSLTAVELLWQPRLGELLATDGSHGVTFGALAAGSMMAVAIGAAAVGPRARRRVPVRTVYLGSLLVTAACIAVLGLPDGAVLFSFLYLLVYLGAGAAEPLHSELLNEAVGSEARATMISADALAAQGGALVANLGSGLLASAASPATAWAVAAGVLALTVAYVAPKLRGAWRPGNIDLIRPIYEEWGRGNWAPRFDVYDAEMEWGWSDEFPGLDGVFRDAESPNSRLRAWLSPWERWQAEADDYLEFGDYVVVLATYRGKGKGSGVEIVQEGAHVFRLRDSKVVRLEIFASREKALAAVALATQDELVGESGTGRRRRVGDD